MVDKVTLLDAVAGTGGLFSYRHIGDLNDHMLNVLQAENRSLDFHTHEESDELFYVIEGAMAMEFEDGLQPLQAGDLIVIPSGVRHRPVVDKLVKVLLIEKKGTLTPDNTGGAYRAE